RSRVLPGFIKVDWPSHLKSGIKRLIVGIERVRRRESLSELLPRLLQKRSLAAWEPVSLTNFPSRFGYNDCSPLWRRTQVVRERSAKPLCIGWNPLGAS